VSESARLDVDLPQGLPAINADETQVRQVVLNLMTNASEAIPAGGGTIFVRTGVVYADGSLLARALPRGELSEGAYVMLEVRDDGVGMGAETRQHVFEPFFSTKFSGRGLGLAAVLGIVHGHGGAILLDSELGQGTRFRVLFPIAQSATSDAEPPAEQPSKPRCGRVLVVDDEEAVSEVAREFLERGGFQVRVAVGGVEGLRVFSEHRAEIDAVVLDWRMPDLDGAGVLKRIRELAPTMPVVIASGLDDPGSGTGGPAAESAGFVSKPFEWETLLGVVGTAIARREPGL
jgi:CheY-like chemotaxis protein